MTGIGVVEVGGDLLLAHVPVIGVAVTAVDGTTALPHGVVAVAVVVALDVLQCRPRGSEGGQGLALPHPGGTVQVGSLGCSHCPVLLLPTQPCTCTPRFLSAALVEDNARYFIQNLVD